MTAVRRLAVVPARGGSKRVPRKNIRVFHGKPMVIHVLEAARNSGVFDTVHVSTEDEEIENVAREYGFAPAFLRPRHLADDAAPVITVVRGVLETYRQQGQDFDTVALIYATAPLIEPHDLEQACRRFEEGDRARPLISVCRYPAPIEWAYRLVNGDGLVPVEPGAFAIPSNDLDDAYYDSAGFIFFDATWLSATTGAGTDQHYRAHVLPFWKGVDIDTPEDWEAAEQLFGTFRGRADARQPEGSAR